MQHLVGIFVGVQHLVGIFVGLLVGMAWGRRLERRSWILRADGDTPHHASGRFWYIVSEGRAGSPTALPERCKVCDKVLPSRWMQHYCPECRAEMDKRCGK